MLHGVWCCLGWQSSKLRSRIIATYDNRCFCSFKHTDNRLKTPTVLQRHRRIHNGDDNAVLVRWQMLYSRRPVVNTVGYYQTI